jgi:2-polyprenyl-3-methyl-5-hydroxy-6-metoxy-1,4-benzoquinol methylase
MNNPAIPSTQEALLSLFPPEPLVRMNNTQIQLRDEFNHKIQSGKIPLEWVPCLCGNKDETQAYLLAKEDRYGLLQPTVICKKCGLIQSNPRMTAEGYEHFYTSDHYRRLYEGDNYNQKYLDSYNSGSGSVILKAVELARKRPVDANDRILEIGAGGGWNLVAFQGVGAAVAGFDYSEQLVALGQSRGIPMKQGSTGEARLLSEKEGAFTIIILNHVLEHFLDPINELKQLRQIGSQDCCLFVGVPRIDYPHRGLLQNAHTYYFTARTLTHYLAVSGWYPNAIVHDHAFAMHTVAQAGTGSPLDISGECARSLGRLKNRRPLLFAVRTCRTARERIREILVSAGLWSMVRDIYRKFR